MDPQRYDELHGSNNWAGLLDPLDLDLRNLLLGYGDLVSAAERAFNNDEGSLYNGYSYYGKSSFFKGTMLPWAESKYRVTSFIYATSRANSLLPLLTHRLSHDGSEFDSNWIGYIAVSNDEYSKSIGHREICIVWRGTLRNYEYLDGALGVMPVSAEPLLPSTSKINEGSTGEGNDAPKIMEGWLTIYNTSDLKSEFIKTSAQTQVLARIKELLFKHKDEKVSITCTGHSLGACLSVLSAFDLARNVVTPDINVSAFIFASPLVGNQSFKAKIEELPNLKVIKVKNNQDPITFWPSKIMKWGSEKVWELMPSGLNLMEYFDVGVEIFIDNNKSPFLKDSTKLHPFDVHNLQGMLHTLSGWNGKDGEFDTSLVKRSLGWVNMSIDLLKPGFKIPTNWWAEKNKGMVLNDDGDWVLSPLDLHDHDLHDKETIS